MRRSVLVLLTLVVVTACGVTFAGDEKAKDEPSSILVEFPIGDLSITYFESAQGMMLELYIDGKEASLTTRRVYIGDGKKGVLFAASQRGFQTPTGVVNAAGLDYDNGAVIEYIQGSETKWASKSGEVYLLVPNIKLKPRAK